MNTGPIIVLLLMFVAWFFVLRTRSTPLDSRGQFDTMVSSGQPVVVDFFSNT